MSSQLDWSSRKAGYPYTGLNMKPNKRPQIDLGEAVPSAEYVSATSHPAYMAAPIKADAPATLIRKALLTPDKQPVVSNSLIHSPRPAI